MVNEGSAPMAAHKSGPEAITQKSNMDGYSPRHDLASLFGLPLTFNVNGLIVQFIQVSPSSVSKS